RRRYRRPQRTHGHRRGDRLEGVLAAAHRHRPSGPQGSRRRLRARQAAQGRARGDRSAVRAQPRAPAEDRERPHERRDDLAAHGSEGRGRRARESRDLSERIQAMSLQCGIVGLPNVGKSTLFNALTKAGIAAENYPFCTIEPNVGIVEVPDPRLAKLAAIAHPQKVVPAIVEFVDIAGLVAGASKGEGLGNQFLANIRETDAIANVVRCFSDENVVHVAGKVDPISDIEVIHTELALADMATVERTRERNLGAARSGNKEVAKLIAVLEK